jgi:hypothetical protein
LLKSVTKAVNMVYNTLADSEQGQTAIMPKDLNSHADIISALKDKRSLQDVEMIRQDDCYLTPSPQLFDFKCQSVDYVQQRLKFICARLGFGVNKTRSNKVTTTHESYLFRCNVGSKYWREKHERKKPANVPHFEICPFGLKYSRTVDQKTQMPTGSFELSEFDLRHNHPLHLVFDRI